MTAIATDDAVLECLDFEADVPCDSGWHKRCGATGPARWAGFLSCCIRAIAICTQCKNVAVEAKNAAAECATCRKVHFPARRMFTRFEVL